MSTSKEPLGTIDISPAAIATIATHATHQCYGVVAMANKNFVDGLTHTLARDNRRGIEVSFEDGDIVIDVYVIVQYGTRIRVVAESIQNTVTFHVEKALGAAKPDANIRVRAVNVYVQGLRINNGPD